MRWLATASQFNHALGPEVWLAFVKATPGDAELRELAVRWLDVAMKHRSWSLVWLSLDKANRARAIAGTCDSLARCRPREARIVVASWLTLWKRSPKNEELSELGHRFFGRIPEGHLRRSQIESA